MDDFPDEMMDGPELENAIELEECPNCGKHTLTDEGICTNCEYNDPDSDEDDDDYEDPWETMERLDQEGRGDEAYGVLLRIQGRDCKCSYCGTRFRGMPDHTVCNSCADKLERGMDLGPFDDGKDLDNEDDPTENGFC
mgnify:CR=1 FL=1